MNNNRINYRRDVFERDIYTIRRIVGSSGFFSSEEIEVAVELVKEFLDKGGNSSYQFLFAEQDEQTLAYTCFGRVPCTVGSYDLYWIAVADLARGQGIGQKLLHETEKAIEALGGRRIYAETSARAQYKPTHAFYHSCGFSAEALLEDFYAPGDGKMIYCKVLFDDGAHEQS